MSSFLGYARNGMGRLIPSLSFVGAKLEAVLRIIRKVPVRTDKRNPVRYRLCYYHAVVRVSVPIVHRQCGIAQQMPPAYLHYFNACALNPFEDVVRIRFPFAPVQFSYLCQMDEFMDTN